MSRRGSIEVRFDHTETSVLRTLPALLESDEDAGGRLSYVAHPDDPVADAEYQDLVAGSLRDLRQADRSGFDRVLTDTRVTPDDLEAFMRVIGEARLVLAARAGIEDDGWEGDLSATTDPQVAMLGWLGFLQDAAVQVLSHHL